MLLETMETWDGLLKESLRGGPDLCKHPDAIIDMAAFCCLAHPDNTFGEPVVRCPACMEAHLVGQHSWHDETGANYTVVCILCPGGEAEFAEPFELKAHRNTFVHPSNWEQATPTPNMPPIIVNRETVHASVLTPMCDIHASMLWGEIQARGDIEREEEARDN